MKRTFAPGEVERFAAAAHRTEAENRRRSPLAFQRAFADVLDGWTDAAERRAEIEEAAAAAAAAPVQLDMFGSAA